MEKSNSIVSRIDWLTVVLYVVLIIIGWISVYSSVYNEEHNSIFDISQRYGKQLIWIIVAFILIIGIFFIESHIISSFSFLIYGVIIFLLIAVLFFGHEVHGSRSWFKIGDFKMQPSEFAKFALSLALAKYMSKENFKLMALKNLIIIGGMILLPAFLILMQNDTGSALVYIVFILVLYREGLSAIYPFLILLGIIIFIASFFFKFYVIFLVIIALSFLFYAFVLKRYKETVFAISLYIAVFIISISVIVFSMINIQIHYVLALSIIPVSILALIRSLRKRVYESIMIIALVIGSISFTYSTDYIFNNVLESHHKIRINVLLGIQEDIKKSGYNVNQSKIAIGSGELTGKGFLQGTQTKYNFVPEQDTDFIFCTIGEEWGFLGTSIVILLFTALIIRILILAEKQKSRFSRVYGYSVASILFFHFGVNIAMTIGLAPVIGIPLPFISYGGSSLWAFTILLFIFLKLDTSRIETL